MKRILAFSFFPAFVPANNGGVSRLYNFYKALSCWHKVTLLTSTHAGVEEELINHGVNFVERRIPKDDHFLTAYMGLEGYSSGGDLSGPAIAACSRLPTRLHKAYLDEYERADIIIHDSPFTIDCDIFAGCDRKPRVYNAYNCETTLYRQLHPAQKSSPIYQIVSAAERRALQISDLVLFCNDADLIEFRSMAPDAQFESLYAPNGMTSLSTARRSIRAGATQRAVFMGSGHPPNVAAAHFIVNTLAYELPEVGFDIIGSCLAEGEYPSNVKRHGLVGDAEKAQLLSQATIALNPMAAGSGSNVKVLDYFAHELPVLSTSFGMRGIRAEAGRDYVEASLEEFSATLRRSLVGLTALAGIGSAGRMLADERYTWSAIAGPVATRLTELVNDRSLRSAPPFVLVLNDYDSFSGIGGGGTRTRGLYEAVKEWSPVVFVSFSADGSFSVRQHDDGIKVFNVPRTANHLADLARLNGEFHISADDIVAARHCTENPWLDRLYGVLREHARCIVVEHCYMAGLPLAWRDRFVYSSQNNECELKRRLLQWHPSYAELLQIVESIERAAVEHAAATIAVSAEDAAGLVKGRSCSGPVIIVRNGAAEPASGPSVEQSKWDLRHKLGGRSVVFLGSAHMPNVEAAQYIIEYLAPALPDVTFHLVGSICGAIGDAPENVMLWGVVDETTKSAVMQSCALALNPMLSGSGSNVKLADYLGNGLFVVTTEFGQRGYPASVQPHLAVASLNGFAGAIRASLADVALHSEVVRNSRRELFARELSMSGLASRFVATLQGLEKKKKRVLYVAYRYVYPALGGAETNIEKFVSALGNSGKFDVDVIAPEVSGIHSHMRFCDEYSFDPECSAPVDIMAVRFARFPIRALDADVVDAHLRNAWMAQVDFERALSESLHDQYDSSGLTWGWGYPEGEGSGGSRWAFSECAVFLQEQARVELAGYAPASVVLSVYSGERVVAGPFQLVGDFTVSFPADAGQLHFVSTSQVCGSDPRPLAFRISRFRIDDTTFDLLAQTLLQRHFQRLPAAKSFRLLDLAAHRSRGPLNVRLTDGRGPWSPSMERYIEENVADYDLVVAHNNIFRPAVVAIAEAAKRGVPSILIPHAHLDDDFYHFPDWLESARNASLVLAVPRAACDFLAEKGCRVQYLPAGCDADEDYGPQDQEAFLGVCGPLRPFVLILGRKAGAKGYRLLIDAVERINRRGVDLQAVLIGPDDDGAVIDSPNAVYLGRQPRNVVRGALLSCLALCNMSSSESFGIVLLEAWRAGKPVLINRACAAFHDMAEDGINAVMADEQTIEDALLALVESPELRDRLAIAGRQQVERFAWAKVCAEFVAIAEQQAESKGY